MARQEMKAWPEPFEAIWRGRKTFEYRPDDRDPPYGEGDLLILREWDSDIGAYSGRKILAEAGYVARGAFGIPEGYCVISLHVVGRLMGDRGENVPGDGSDSGGEGLASRDVAG